MDEFQSAAFLALVESALRYDPARNVDFATYARHHIGGALCDCRRALLQGGSPRDAAAPRTVIPLSTVASEPGRVLHAEADDPPDVALERQETVEAWINRLPRAHSRAFRLIYLDGRTQEETAVVIGCSKARVSRLHEQGLAWLQHGLAGRLDRRWHSQAPAMDACA
jgi:RNA polymerase sigma factor (sigma-70 family)